MKNKPWEVVPPGIFAYPSVWFGEVAGNGVRDYANAIHIYIEDALINAYKISAAKEMYSVLKELEDSIEYWSEYDVPIGIVDRIRFAITKAEGFITHES